MARLEFHHPKLGSFSLNGSHEELSHIVLLLFNSEIEESSASEKPESIIKPVKLNRREMALNALGQIHKEGHADASIAEIRQVHARLFPEDDAGNLDQVLRDLVNKAGKVERTGWGCFKIKTDS